MDINETRKIIVSFFDGRFSFHSTNSFLNGNAKKYNIKPDDAFYFKNSIVLIEYENNKRPVESISKYFWLYKKTDWVEENMKIYLLLTINNRIVEENYKSRIEAIEIIGNELQIQFPNLFNFHFLNYSKLSEENIIAKLNAIIG